MMLSSEGSGGALTTRACARPACETSTSASTERSGCVISLNVEQCLEIDIDSAFIDTASSALTGRHQPAAREYSHLFRSESCALAPSFSLVTSGIQAIHERRLP